MLLALAFPARIAGVYPVDDSLGARWGDCGTWQLPVGSPEKLGDPGREGEPAFKVNRNLEYSGSRMTHEGADLANGRAGDPVHAAANGLVVLATESDAGSGYGAHVVLAHRDDDGRLLYSVYAHLQRGSMQVHPGDLVVAGDPLARVGRTGRATCDHLHFEVREADAPEERWENTEVLDPLAFVDGRMGLGTPDAGEPGHDTYVTWAARAGLVGAGASADGAITRAAWWRMLARTTPDGPSFTGSSGDALRDSLMQAGVLPDEESGAPADEPLAWSEMARDLKRLQQLGARVPRGPLPAAAHDSACAERVGQRAPAAHAAALRHRAGAPSLADACLLLADVGGPRLERHAPVRGKAGAQVRPAKAKRRAPHAHLAKRSKRGAAGSTSRHGKAPKKRTAKPRPAAHAKKPRS